MGMPVISPSGVSRCQAISDVIESVALEQAAIAHILNAEGEKLQAAIAASVSDVNQMLAANESVRAMVDTLVGLEIALRDKLGLFANCLCECGAE